VAVAFSGRFFLSFLELEIIHWWLIDTYWCLKPFDRFKNDPFWFLKIISCRQFGFGLKTNQTKNP